MALPPPPSVLRIHTRPVGALHISDDARRIYSADASGRVVCTSAQTLRPITVWTAHSDALLTLEEWDSPDGKRVVTHGRDNKLHVWTCIHHIPTLRSAAVENLPVPSLCLSMDVNALNYCSFSLLSPYIALPNLIESSEADIWSLPVQDRIHAAIGKQSTFGTIHGRAQENATGIIMSLHLYSDSQSEQIPPTSLRILCAYEHGGVILRKYTNAEKEKSVEGKGWEIVWSVKLHAESVMAMRVSPSNTFALTTSADNLIGYYNLQSTDPNAHTVHRTKHPGNSSVAIRSDGRVVAIGGWDGRIRLYSTKSFKHLGTLKYHKEGVQALEFMKPAPVQPASDESDDEEDQRDAAARSRWLLSGSKDNRVAIWGLMSFERENKGDGDSLEP